MVLAIESQQQLMSTQNMRALTKNFISKIKEDYTNMYSKYFDKTNQLLFASELFNRQILEPFFAYGTYKYPSKDNVIKNILYLKPNNLDIYDEIGVVEKYKMIDDKNIFNNLAKFIKRTESKFKLDTGTQQNISMSENANIKLSNKLSIVGIQKAYVPIYCKDINEYINPKNNIYHKINDHIYISENLTIDQYFWSPYIVIYNHTLKNIFIITYLEGLKYIDNAYNNKSLFANTMLTIYDSLGNVMFTNMKDNIVYIGGAINVLMKCIISNTHVTMESFEQLFFIDDQNLNNAILQFFESQSININIDPIFSNFINLYKMYITTHNKNHIREAITLYNKIENRDTICQNLKKINTNMGKIVFDIIKFISYDSLNCNIVDI